MTRHVWHILAAALVSAAVAGCAKSPELEAITKPGAGFETVKAKAKKGAGQTPVWVHSSEEAQAAANRSSAILRKKPLTADAAVQVALINNKGLQAAYADIGMAAAEIWQQSLPVNPKVSIGLMGIGALKTLETTVVSNILALMTKERRVAIADARFRQAQMRSAETTLKLAADTRRAWIRAVAARERLTYLEKEQLVADAASETTRGLGKTGAFNKEMQARQYVANAEVAGQVAQARLDVRTSREALTRFMGAWGKDISYSLPGELPQLPARPETRRAIEAFALKNRVDLKTAQIELEALAKSYGLTEATRYVTDLELLGGLEFEQEKAEEEGEKDKIVTTARLELEFVIPIFDTGEARFRKAEYAYVKAANQLAEKAVNIRSEAREAYDRYRSTYEIARHQRDRVIPLRRQIEEQAVLTYNGMISSNFDLLADTRATYNAILASVSAKEKFWLANVDLITAVYGGGGGSGGEASETQQPSGGGEGGGGH